MPQTNRIHRTCRTNAKLNWDLAEADAADLAGIARGERVVICQDNRRMHGTVSSVAQKPAGIVVRVKLDGDMTCPVQVFPLAAVRRF